MRILILGGGGFLGCNLVRYCLERGGNQLTVVDFFDPRMRSDRRHLDDVAASIELIEGDIRDAGLMEEVIQEKDVVFNCAAQTSHSLSLEDPFWDAQINCLGSLTLLEAARRYNPQAAIVYVSSSTVIGRAEGEVVTEEHGESPLEVYSANKGTAEKYYRIYKRVHELNTVVLRFANLYGPYGKGYPEFGFLNYFIDRAFHGLEIRVFGDGSQSRNVMYVEDAVRLLYDCAMNRKLFGEIYFAVHEEHYSILEIAEAIIRVFGRGSVRQVPWPDLRKRIEIGDMIISGAKLFNRIAWRPQFKFEEGLRRTKEWMVAMKKRKQERVSV